MRLDTDMYKEVLGGDVSRLKIVGLGFVFLWFFLGSMGHFFFTKAEVGIVPHYIPAPYLVVYVTGVFELLGAIGILLKEWRQKAGLGLFLLTVAVTPANVYMAQHAYLYPRIPPTLLDFRLVFQVFLLAIIWWVSRPVRL